jgi:hypothetical protein
VCATSCAEFLEPSDIAELVALIQYKFFCWTLLGAKVLEKDGIVWQRHDEHGAVQLHQDDSVHNLSNPKLPHVLVKPAIRHYSNFFG